MMTDDDLESLFSAAREARPEPCATLTARILTDAATVQASVTAEAPRALAPKASLWAGVLALFGGGGALAGMATATVAGLYIGFAQPVGAGMIASVMGSDTATMDMMPGIDALLEEAP